MSKKDVFAGIAAGGAGGRKELLEETLPLEKPKRYFSPSENEIAFPQQPDYKQELDSYHRGIENLKVRFSPFLRRECGPAKTNRKKTFLKNFIFSFEGSNKTESVSIPHYTGPKGRWTAYYETQFKTPAINKNRRLFIVFKGVDYYADVFINNNLACSHEGFFAPFECDITDFLEETNNLVVKVGNDIPTIGNGDMQVNGDKLYAATGLGWDDPLDGWHHCPAGGGIFDNVYLEERDSLYIDDIFIRPDIDSGTVEINISVFSPYEENTEITLSGDIMPYNFEGNANGEITLNVTAGYGLNYYSHEIEITGYRLWETDAPYLYLVRMTAGSDTLEKTFGMRKFHMDTEGEPKGSLFLNNKPIFLRGANEMGHLQLCVMRDDYEQLIEDILIARYCNMNYYRITQRPVQEEIYHYCDMLGMLSQADLPLFGYMRKNKFHEGVKQAGEMERLIRNHPSVIMSTYINEPFAPDKYGLGYRHMSRPELELFFDACDAAVRFENPDRVIKRVEGDYDPPTNEGMSDFHCYNMWYTNHALPIGMLYKGYLPPLNKGWKTGCGEYGAEGLDNIDVMRKYYPSDWLPEKNIDKWIPDKIVKAQSNTMHGDWYEEQDNILDWIEQSQSHQAFATELMTLSFRRRSDMIVSTAIHLLIDAWPSGWMKTLLDVDRIPKKAYFAFKKSLEPLAVNLRSDRWSAYSGEILNIEAWVLNDTDRLIENDLLLATVFLNGKIIQCFALTDVECKPCTSVSAGLIPVEIPKADAHSALTIKLGMNNGKELITDSLEIDVYPRAEMHLPVFGIGAGAEIFIKNTPGLESVSQDRAEAFIISKQGTYESSVHKRVFIRPDKTDGTYIVNGEEFKFKTIFDPDEVGENGELKGLSFTALSDKIKKWFHGKAFSYWYNESRDVIDHVAEYYIDGRNLDYLVYGYEKPSWGRTTSGRKTRLPIAAKNGDDIFISFETQGRSGVNPVLDLMIQKLLTE